MINLKDIEYFSLKDLHGKNVQLIYTSDEEDGVFVELLAAKDLDNGKYYVICSDIKYK